MSDRKLRGRVRIRFKQEQMQQENEFVRLLHVRRMLIERLKVQMDPEMLRALKFEVGQIERNLTELQIKIVKSTGGPLEPRSEPEPTLQGLFRFADWFGLNTRKAIKALAGDYEVEIRRLRQEGRPGVAQWNSVLAWGYALVLVLKSPVSWVVSRALNAFRGSGA
jgi:hypothetical protein